MFHIKGNILITIIRFPRPLASSAYFQQNVHDWFLVPRYNSGQNKHDWTLLLLTSTKSVICQKDVNCSKFYSPNWLLFHIRAERLKLTYYSLISNFSRYYFKTGTLCLFFLFSHVFPALELDSNCFGFLLWKVKPCDHNETKLPVGKLFRNINQSDIVLQCPDNNCRAHL